MKEIWQVSSTDVTNVAICFEYLVCSLSMLILRIFYLYVIQFGKILQYTFRQLALK